MKVWKIGLMVALQLLIVVVAGAIIHWLEHAAALEEAAEVQKELAQFRANHACLSDAEVRELSRTLDRAHILKLNYHPGTRGLRGSSWDFASSTYAALQIISSIGFGASAPQSSGGKVFLVFFALVGIPLFVAVIFGCSLQLLALSDFIRRCCWSSAASKDYWLVHIVRTLILLLVGFVLWCLLPVALFQTFDPSLPYWQTVATVSVLFIGPGQFVPAQLEDQAQSSKYRIFVGFWTLCHMLWFVGVITSTYRVIIEHVDESKFDIPDSFTLGRKSMAMVSRVWVNQGGDGGKDGKKGGGMRWKNCCGRKNGYENDDDYDDDGGGGGYSYDGGMREDGDVTASNEYIRGGSAKAVSGNVNVVYVGN